MSSQLVTRISDKSITVVLDGKVKVVHANAANFNKLQEALKKPAGVANFTPNLDLIRDLVDISSFIVRETHGDVDVSDNQVRYKGEKVEGVIVTRILAHLKEGYSIAPLANFLAKLMQNPLPTIRADLFAWLENGDMPIAEDGDLIAYKNVQRDYYSHHSGKRGKVLHAMGTIVTMPREEVDASRYNDCSTGLHFCSYSYLSNYNGGKAHNRTLIVKINPADVVAIPQDYNRAKGRAWRMFVFDEVVYEQAEKALVGKLLAGKTGVHASEGTARISGDDDNSLGEDNKGEAITIARLRGLLAHGGVDYTAKALGVTHDRVTAMAELIDFKDENMGTATASAPTPIALPKTPMKEVKAKPSTDKKKPLKKAAVKAVVKAVKKAAQASAPVAAPVQAGAAGAFTHNGKTYGAQEVLDGLTAHGQRGFSAISGIPRTTLQTWKARIEKQ